MTEKEIMIFENTLKNYHVKSPNELAERLKQMENDKNVIRGLQKAIKERDEIIAKNADNLSKLKECGEAAKNQLEETKTSSLNDKLKLIEQVKQKDQRIAELEEKNKNLKKENQQRTDTITNLIITYKKDMAICSKENAKLQEQLKNATKYKLGQDVFMVIDNIEKAKIEKTIQTMSKAEEECSIWYSLTDKYGYALRLPEEQIFSTEAEAQKYLEKNK